MRRIILLSSTVALALALAVIGSAAQSATVVLRSGERIAGELVDMGASGFSVRVSGNVRRIPTGEVAVIDFGGGANFPSNETSRVTGGQHLIVLSSGQSVTGRLTDIGGRSAAAHHRRHGERQAGFLVERSAAHLSRVTARGIDARCGRAPAAGCAPGASAADRRTDSCARATSAWVDTGLTVRRGESVAFNASGRVQLSANANDTAGPAGAESGRRPTGPMAGVLAGALIGRIGPVSMFAIGNQTNPLPMPADGRLFLGVNDDEVNDNTGEFVVDVRPANP